MIATTPTGIWAVFPHLNASLNACAFACIVAGLIAIKRRRIELHKKCMLSAAAFSAVFLACYITYHSAHLRTEFKQQGPIRTVYFVILISHTILAIVQVPLIVITILSGLKNRIDRHRRVAKITAPIWLYVSLTGVVVYWMLYRL